MGRAVVAKAEEILTEMHRREIIVESVVETAIKTNIRSRTLSRLLVL